MTAAIAVHARLPDAATRLQAWMVAHCARPFAWGTADCVVTAADAVLAVAGRDPMDGIRGTYATAGQAAATLHQLGGMHALLDARFGQRLPVCDAMDGDVVLLSMRAARGPLSEAGGVAVVWRGQAVAQGAIGLVTRPLSDATGAWGVY